MNQIDTVFQLAEEFVQNSKVVTINTEKLRSLAAVIEASVNWHVDYPLPDGISLKDAPPDEHLKKMFLYELIANSVNYCFWYGRHDIRPNGASSTKMYALLDESFLHLEQEKKTRVMDSEQELELIIRSFIGKLCRARFPMMDHRVRHLNELLDRPEFIYKIDETVEKKTYDADAWIDYLITTFPGYGADMFLKRTFLFIIQMYRRCGLFDTSRILVPADYHIPKMLRWLGCITYNDDLSYAVDTCIPILAGSFVECEIRAATIWVCNRIAELTGCTCEEVDTYLFAQRHSCTDPFHLTVTTDY